MRTDIDITYDFRHDTPAGLDPDKHRKTLRRYHRLLWSRPLPSGELFELSDATPGAYLHHRSAKGEFAQSSDSVIPTLDWSPAARALIPDDEMETFNALTYTIGGMMIFPSNAVDRKMTINGARGCHPRIRDRFDLTIECIRRHYGGGESPLTGVLARYANFFDLFVDFRGYVEFFLLQDLVSSDFSAVRVSVPFDDFTRSPIPTTIEEYSAYQAATVAFIRARNQRILSSA